MASCSWRSGEQVCSRLKGGLRLGFRGWLLSNIDGGYAEGKAAEIHVNQAGFSHFFGEGFPLEELADALGEIAVGAFAIAGEKLADPWQHVAKIPAVKGLERLPRGRGKLQDGDATAGCADSGHFS